MSPDIRNIHNRNNPDEAQGSTQEIISEILSLANEIAADPDNSEACINLCKLFVSLRRIETDTTWIKEAVSKNRDLSKVFINLSTSLFEEGQMVESGNILEAIVWGDPDNHEGWNDLGAVRFSVNELSTAEKAFKHALTLKHGYSDALMNLCTLYLAKGQQLTAVTTALTCLEDEFDVTPEFLCELAGVIGNVAPVEATKLMERAVVLQNTVL